MDYGDVYDESHVNEVYGALRRINEVANGVIQWPEVTTDGTLHVGGTSTFNGGLTCTNRITMNYSSDGLVFTHANGHIRAEKSETDNNTPFRFYSAGRQCWGLSNRSNEDFWIQRHDPATSLFIDAAFSISSSSGQVTIPNSINVADTLVVTSTTFGLFGAGSARPADYTAQAPVVNNRVLPPATTATLAELHAVVSQLLADLAGYGIIGGV